MKYEHRMKLEVHADEGLFYFVTQVVSPNVFNKALWEKSGHWEKYRKNMFHWDCDNVYIRLYRAVAHFIGHVWVEANELPRPLPHVPARSVRLNTC